MANTKHKTKRKPLPKAPTELDGVYFLKIVMYLIVGSQWIRLTDSSMSKQLPLPVGLTLGGIFAMHDHFMIDRKIEYAILLMACLVGFWSQVGVYINILH